MPLANNWLQSGKGFSEGDFNYDGVVDQYDLTLLAQRWQVYLAPPPPPVPASAVGTSPARGARTPTRTPVRTIALVADPQAQIL